MVGGLYEPSGTWGTDALAAVSATETKRQLPVSEETDPPDPYHYPNTGLRVLGGRMTDRCGQQPDQASPPEGSGRTVRGGSVCRRVSLRSSGRCRFVVVVHVGPG